MYLLDREAITTGLIKVLWVNEHGQTLWENRVEPSTLTGLSMAQEDSCGLAEIVGYRAVRGASRVRMRGPAVYMCPKLMAQAGFRG